MNQKYWTLVKVDLAGRRKVVVIPPVKDFFTTTFPELAAQTQLNHPQIQIQLWQWMEESRNEQSLLAQRCLLCFISWQIERVCRKLAAQFGRVYGFSSADLFPFVLHDDGRFPQLPSAHCLSQEILNSFDLARGSLTNWTIRKTKQYPALADFLIERGVYLISDWAILNDSRPQQIERVFRDFHQLTSLEIQQSQQLLSSYHAIYRYQRLQQRRQIQGRCLSPTPEQLQQISDDFARQTQLKIKPAQVMTRLRQIATRLREYRIHIRGGSLPTKSIDTSDDEHRSPSVTLSSVDKSLTNEDGEENEFLQLYEQEFISCLDQVVAIITQERLQKIQRLNKKRSQQFLLALYLFHCQRQSMPEIADSVGLSNQYTVTRLLKLKDFRADIRQRLLLKLSDRILDLTRYYANPEHLKTIENKVEEALNEKITEIIEEAAKETHLAKDNLARSLFSQRLCRYLDGLI
ncbi:MAG: hypothetical protein WA919_03695 [Coleofasciculaceae cyanobacterium]